MSWIKGVPNLVLVGALAGMFSAGAAHADRTAVPAGVDTSSFVGADTCLDCHDDKADSFGMTTHGRTGMSNWDGATGCETCHGPGAEHAKSKGKVQNMRKLDEVTPREASGVCLQCHDRGDHANWWGSTHESRGLSCISCHKIHHDGKPPQALLARETVFDTCRTCHLRRIANLARSSHMPVREESITCTSCHNPHGGQGPSMLKQYSVNENCYSCHAEKRSPMLWEHAPVKEQCTLCHDPHGSLHPHLLVAKLPRLCQQCHDEGRHPTQTYDSLDTSDVVFRPERRTFNSACVNCHTQIHGSNHPSGVRFMR